MRVFCLRRRKHQHPSCFIPRCSGWKRHCGLEPPNGIASSRVPGERVDIAILLPPTWSLMLLLRSPCHYSGNKSKPQKFMNVRTCVWRERLSFMEHKEFWAASTPFLELNVPKQRRKREVRCGLIRFTVEITRGNKKNSADYCSRQRSNTWRLVRPEAGFSLSDDKMRRLFIDPSVLTGSVEIYINVSTKKNKKNCINK